MRISDWSSDVCSSDLDRLLHRAVDSGGQPRCGRREHDPRAVDDAHVPIALAGDAHRPRQRPDPLHRLEIGRATRRERGWQYVEMSVGALSYKKKNKK